MSGQVEAAVKEKPILFSAPMVRAILAGRKTVTRRVVKPQPEEGCGIYELNEAPGWHVVAALPGFPNGGMPMGEVHCPYGKPGERLWAREAWRRPHVNAGAPLKPGQSIAYRATHDFHDGFGEPWRPSIHMPRWASRITLEVTDVRVERVQSIAEQDAAAEGAFTLDTVLMQDAARSGAARGQKSVGPIDYFRELWNELNASRGFSWESNPFVWRIEFRRL